MSELSFSTHPDYPHIDTLRDFLRPANAWVLFEHGTVVVTPPAVEHRAAYATLRLRKDAAQAAGTAAGDYSVRELPYGGGYAVSSHDPRIFTIVPHAEIGEHANDVTIGIAGRAAHGADADGGEVVHVETPNH